MASLDMTPHQPQVDRLLGFELDRDARRLILSFFTFSFIIIGLGAIAATLVAYTRAPSIMLLNPKWYYMTLTYHGILMLTMFPHLFEMGLMIYVCTALLKSRLYSNKLAWVGFWLCFTGIATILITIAFGDSSVMYTMYVPLRANGMFYLGHFLYALGLLTEIIVFALTVMAWKANNPGKSLPLVTYGGAVMAILLLTAIISAVVAFLPATLWAFRILVPSVDPMVFKAAFWGMGHTLQYGNIVGMVMGWYMISVYVYRAKPVSEKFSRMAFALYTLTTVPVMAHHLLVDPTFDIAFKYVGATLFGAFLGIPSLMHGLAVPAAFERSIRQQLRAEGKPVSRFAFLRNWGWHNPVMIMTAFAVVNFGIGGWDGTVATTVPLNMILHNTLYITAHFHGTLAAGMAVSYMAMAYYMLPSMGIDIVGKGWAKFQAWCTGSGFLLLVIGMHWAGEMGVPRRTQDIHYAAAGAPTPNWFAATNFLAVGGSLAAIGILTFVAIALTSLYKARSGEARQPLRFGIWGEPWAEKATAKVAEAR